MIEAAAGAHVDARCGFDRGVGRSCSDWGREGITLSLLVLFAVAVAARAVGGPVPRTGHTVR